MTVFEDIKNGALVEAVAPSQAVEVVSTGWIGDQAITVIYRVPGGSVPGA